jgi:hypothetical protein
MSEQRILNLKEQERLAYIQGNTSLAMAFGDQIEALEDTAKVSEIKGRAEEAYQYLLGEDFMQDLIDTVRQMSTQRVTKDDVKNLVNVMEDFQMCKFNESDCAREELNKIINA